MYSSGMAGCQVQRSSCQCLGGYGRLKLMTRHQHRARNSELIGLQKKLRSDTCSIQQTCVAVLTVPSPRELVNEDGRKGAKSVSSRSKPCSGVERLKRTVIKETATRRLDQLLACYEGQQRLGIETDRGLEQMPADEGAPYPETFPFRPSADIARTVSTAIMPFSVHNIEPRAYRRSPVLRVRRLITFDAMRSCRVLPRRR